ncbi:SpoIIE family protein phosphatase [Pseudonocardia halophobica]|uniref:SpoIIE family protein phosphatase n=1 Tax=Pseudonocardia halophobica TaxID=29401 RepID=UPI003D8B6E38
MSESAVGGDFVDWQAQPDGRLVMTLADVMGKGLAAGLVAATVKTALHTESRRHPPAEGRSSSSAAAASRTPHTTLAVSVITIGRSERARRSARLSPKTSDGDRQPPQGSASPPL